MEQARNMFGFMAMAAAIGIFIVISRSFIFGRIPRILPSFLILGSSIALGFFAFWLAGLLELEIAYAFTLPSLKMAKSVTGVPVSKVIDIPGTRWTTDDYFAGNCGNHDNLICVRLEAPSNNWNYYFAYDSRTHVIVPMTETAAKRFPELMPPQDRLASLCEIQQADPSNEGPPCISIGTGGGDEIKLPEKWFQNATR